MARAWAPHIESIQAALVAAILAERDAVASSLPDNMHGDGVQAHVGLTDDEATDAPYLFRVLPPGASSFRSEVTGEALEAVLAFPVYVRVRGATTLDTTVALREAQGLVLDALMRDATLGGLVAGPGDPAVDIGSVFLDGAEATQEILLRVVTRR